MSKPVKNLIIDQYKEMFDRVDNALVIDLRGINAIDNNTMRLSLAEKQIRVTVIKNTLAKKALAGTALQPLEQALVGPSALAYGGTSVVDVARQLIDWARKVANLTLKAAVLDGEYFDGADGVKRLSTFPTRAEAQATVVQLVLSPGGRILSAAKSPGSNILGIVKQIQEKLEKGETIAKVG